MRLDEDALGQVTLPDHAYYGVHTQRARDNFAVSGRTLGEQTALVTAIAQVKKAAALANLDIGVLRAPVAHAICQAADEIATGTLGPDQFPVDVLSAGGGVSPNMNVNEVIACRANEILTGQRGYEFVHPNNHVNAGQSTSDAMATAVNIALHRDILALRAAVADLAQALRDKIDEHRDTVKLSRTCLQDAVPVTFGQAFGAYLAVVDRGVTRLASAAEACLDVPMGGTVVGTGLGVGAGYVDGVYPRLREVTGLDLRRHPNFFDAFQNGDVFQYISTIFKALACGLIKIAKDLRILASGNRAGLGEITLPAVQAGSSFMPGKVNPVMAELVVQVGLQVCGNDTVVTMAVEGAELDFNAWTAVIVKNLFESIHLLTHTLPLFADKCLRGLTVHVDHNRRTAERSLGLSTVVGGVYGYDAGAKAAHHAADHDLTIKQAVIDLGIAPTATANRLLDPVTLTDANRSAHLLDDLLTERQTTTTALVNSLSPTVRAAIYHATHRIALADNNINQQEQHALAVVADALNLHTTPTSPATPTPTPITPAADEPHTRTEPPATADEPDLHIPGNLGHLDNVGDLDNPIHFADPAGPASLTDPADNSADPDTPDHTSNPDHTADFDPGPDHADSHADSHTDRHTDRRTAPETSNAPTTPDVLNPRPAPNLRTTPNARTTPENPDLHPTREDLDASTLTDPERRLTYACAAWLAAADSVTDTAEQALLADLQHTLGLDDPTADTLRADIDDLRAQRRRYLPRSEQLPWWEEFSDLLVRLIPTATP